MLCGVLFSVPVTVSSAPLADSSTLTDSSTHPRYAWRHCLTGWLLLLCLPSYYTQVAVCGQQAGQLSVQDTAANGNSSSMHLHTVTPAAPTASVLPDAAGTAAGSAGSSFTRVLVYELKPDVLAQLNDGDEGRGVLRDLAHLYHYYLHGPAGNSFTCVMG